MLRMVISLGWKNIGGLSCLCEVYRVFVIFIILCLTCDTPSPLPWRAFVFDLSIADELLVAREPSTVIILRMLTFHCQKPWSQLSNPPTLDDILLLNGNTWLNSSVHIYPQQWFWLFKKRVYDHNTTRVCFTVISKSFVRRKMLCSSSS